MEGVGKHWSFCVDAAYRHLEVFRLHVALFEERLFVWGAGSRADRDVIFFSGGRREVELAAGEEQRRSGRTGGT
jgi:hypothetical protein